MNHVQVILYEGDNVSPTSAINVPKRYVSEITQDDTLIIKYMDLNTVNEYFNIACPRFIDGNQYPIDLQLCMKYLELAQYLNHKHMITEISTSIALYLQGDAVKNLIRYSPDVSNEILTMFNSMSNDTYHEVVSKIKINELEYTMEQCKEKEWGWHTKELCSNPLLTKEIINQNGDKPWYIYDIPGYITSELVIQNPQFNWNWEELSGCPTIGDDVVLNNLDKLWDWNKLTENSAISIDLILRYNNDPSVWSHISYRKDLTLEFIRANIDKPWNWIVLFNNPIMTIEFFEENIDIIDSPIVWDTLSANSKMTLKFIEDHPDKDWNWTSLSDNPILTEEFIDRYPDKDWNWGYSEGWDNFGISNRKDISHAFLLRHLDKEWDFVVLSSNSVIATPDFIEEHMEFDWCWYTLSSNTSMTIEFVLRHSNMGWNWDVVGLSANPNIARPEIIEQNLDLPWNWGAEGLSEPKGPVITLDFITRFIDKDWDWSLLSLSSIITQDFVEKNINKPWNWSRLSKNPNIATPSFIDKYINKEWNWGELGLSRNPSITSDFIIKYKYKPWNWYSIPTIFTDIKTFNSINEYIGYLTA